MKLLFLINLTNLNSFLDIISIFILIISNIDKNMPVYDINFYQFYKSEILLYIKKKLYDMFHYFIICFCTNFSLLSKNINIVFIAFYSNILSNNFISVNDKFLNDYIRTYGNIFLHFNTIFCSATMFLKILNKNTNPFVLQLQNSFT